MKNNLTSVIWWKAAGVRALRTMLLVAVTYVPATATDAVPYVVLGSAALVAGILSLITSLAGIGEVTGVAEPWYFSILSRVVKTIAQALAGGVLANVVFLSDIHWDAVLATTITAGFGSLLLAVLNRLPEVIDPTIPPVVAIAPQGEVPVSAITTAEAKAEEEVYADTGVAPLKES